MKILRLTTRFRRWLAIAFSSCWIVLFLQSQTPALPNQSVANQSVTNQSVTNQAVSTGSITAGITAYEGRQFSAAIAHWQTALTAIDTTEPNAPLTRAYLLSNLASAYQQLGQIPAASTALTESLEILEAWPEHTQTYWQVAARVLNTQGRNQWQQGQTAAALTSWQTAEQYYQQISLSSETSHTDRQSSDQTKMGLMLTQINQALALQELGFNAQATERLRQLRQQLPPLNDSIQLSIVTELGKAMRRIGALNDARNLLTTSLTNATRQSLSYPTLQLELAHTVRSLSHRAIALGQRADAQSYTNETIDHYRQVENIAGASPTSHLLKARAQLNRLSYLIEIGQIENAQTLWPQIDLTALPTSRDSTEAYISYAHSLNCLRSPTSNTCTKKEWQKVVDVSASYLPPTSEQQNRLLQSLTTAIQQSTDLADPLIESYAVGELGHTYELTGQYADAIRLTERALQLVEGKQKPEVAYRWEWQLGRLYQQPQALQSQTQQPQAQQPPANASKQNRQRTAEKAKASAAYQRALTSLASVRQNLLIVDTQVQFSFRDNVEPVYREFIDLLLSTYHQESSAELSLNPSIKSTDNDQAANNQRLLRLAVQTLDALQLTELENFLGCNLSQIVSLSDANSDPKAVKIYPILLPQQLAIIIEPPNQPLTLRTVDISQENVEAALSALRENLILPGKTPAVVASARQLYQWLIEPIEPVLAENDTIETLVFVLDGALRNVPMGVLYDGEQYLVEKEFAIAIAPQLDLFAPHPTPQKLKILRGGIGLPQTVRGQNFPPIELIQTELNQIPENLTVSSPLLNEAFTQANIETQLATKTYSAIHWKTHGVFSSSPGETFLVAYKDGITANELSDLVRSASEQQAEPLELLVLSACATAQGDRRAVLGLAGIAVRAGTRSTLSTLWRADDRANTALMSSFYKGINSGLTKAQALQRAQQELLQDLSYPAPYYWAPYLLVGNWL